MPVRPSGAPTRAASKSTPKKSAPKSFKADGTPKKRWTSGERADRGHGARRRGGQASVRARGPRADRAEGAPSADLAAAAKSSDRAPGAKSYDRAPAAKSYDRAPAGKSYDRPAAAQSDPRPERRSFDRPQGSSASSRTSSGERKPSFDRSRGPASRWDRDAAPRAERLGRPERPARPERPGRTERTERGDRPGSESSADTMSWTAREISADSLTAVRGENGFARLGLPKALVSALQAEGITSPFPIQAATIPDALTGRDVLGRGQTGSGKTLGFGLPMLANLSGSGATGPAPRGLVLVPTRELAMQVADVLAPLAHTVGLSVTLIAGGMAYGPQFKAFERGVDIVVATPGRLIDLMEQGAVDLSRIEVTVLDEADHMADLGFMPAVTTILDAVPAGGQRMLFSATLDRAVDRLVRSYLQDPVTHEVDSGQASVSTMAHHLVHVLPHDKNALTAEIAGRPGRTLIFVRTQRGADRVAEQLREAGVLAGALHGGLTQGARTRILAAFKDGHVPVLVATDVAARGIHVDDIGLVLQVDPPTGSKDYLHRAGRTARAGGQGVVVTLALPHQRRDVQRLTAQAGVRSTPVEARPGDPGLTEITGGRTAVGAAVSTTEYERLIAPHARGGGGPKRRDFAPRSPGRGGSRNASPRSRNRS